MLELPADASHARYLQTIAISSVLAAATIRRTLPGRIKTTFRIHPKNVRAVVIDKGAQPPLLIPPLTSAKNTLCIHYRYQGFDVVISLQAGW